MCKIISFAEYKDKKIEETIKESKFTLDELMVKFDELSVEKKADYLLDREEIEQLLLQVEEIDAPF
jgi:hypothetical protein